MVSPQYVGESFRAPEPPRRTALPAWRYAGGLLLMVLDASLETLQIAVAALLIGALMTLPLSLLLRLGP